MTTESENGVREQFEMGPHAELSVSNVSGSVTVDAVDGSQITVRARRSRSRSRDNAEIDIRKDGNKVSVQTKTGQFGLMNFGRSSAIDYSITVPKDCSVRLNTVGADVKVTGCRAEVGVQTVSGDVSLNDIAGDLTATTVSGDIQGGLISGTLVARTTSGDCQLRRSRLRRFSVNSVSGDFSIETPLISGEQCYAKTISGDLSLMVPGDTKATIHLKSVSGSVGCELPAEIVRSGRRHWQGRINGGGAQLEMTSVSGDLSIRRGDGAVSDAPEPPQPPRAPLHPREPARWREDEPAIGETVNETHDGIDNSASSRSGEERPEQSTAEILAALERGELTVDEAMGLLDDLQR